MPKVSVIVPTFNCAEFIGAALTSIFTQSFGDYEVIVIDDGSTDDTEAVLESWKERIRYVRQANQGPASARNRAVALSEGELLAYLDADDIWLPHKLARQVAYLEDHPECGLVHGEVSVIDENGALLHEHYDHASGRIALRGHCTNRLLKNSIIHTSSVIERRCHFHEAGGFEESLCYAEDYLHWIRLAINGHTFEYIDEPLALYRWRAGSLVRTAATQAQSEALIRVYRSLLEDKAIRARLRSEDLEAVNELIVSLHRGLAYEYRKLGQGTLARGHAIQWVGMAPTSTAAYLEWVKACILGLHLPR